MYFLKIYFSVFEFKEKEKKKKMILYRDATQLLIWRLNYFHEKGGSIVWKKKKNSFKQFEHFIWDLIQIG